MESWNKHLSWWIRNADKKEESAPKASKIDTNMSLDEVDRMIAKMELMLAMVKTIRLMMSDGDKEEVKQLLEQVRKMGESNGLG